MKTKTAKPNGRTPRTRPAPKPAGPRLRTKTFRDGSAVILDERGGIIGLIEARTPYRAQKHTKRRRMARKPE